ncbi:MAG: pyridoxal-phosphate dependent enzyme, partial [Actinomycetota bacterium]|nr:pyridoxal-phosphate dependent enzyme [Actinomycetota bacterium]
QVTGAFKIRGATNKLATLQRCGTLAGVTAASAGNHALALASAAQAAHVPCEIFVPIGAPITKIEAAQKFGAVIHEVAPSLEDALALAATLSEESGYVLCHPYDDPAVIAGQGTLGLELLDDIDDLATVIVPLGGGGLASGIAIAVKSARPRVRVVGVQTAACAPYAGGTTRPGPIATLADGIAVKHPGIVTGPLVEQWLDEVVTVDEEAIADAMVLLMDRAKLYVEGAGAVGVAALLSGTVVPAASGTTCVVLSGGNVDLGVVPGLIRRHETSAGRRLVVFAKIDDRPGGLARLLAVFGAAGANLIAVEHLREGVNLHVRETEVHCTFEVRGHDHAVAIIEAAKAAGYDDVRVDSPVR